MQKKNNYLLLILGIFLLLAGLYCIKFLQETNKTILTLGYILIGIGCGTFGQSLGNIISYKSIEKHPDIQNNIDIEKTDERNIILRNKAKSKAFDVMIFLYSALILALALMSVEFTVLLFIILAYLFIIGCEIYYFNKYSKEM